MSPTAITLAISVLAILGFAWGMLGAFRPVGGSSIGNTVLKASSVTAWLLQMVVLRSTTPVPDSLNYWFGNLLIVAGVALFWHCVHLTSKHRLAAPFSDDEPEFFFMGDAYRYVRHPFYLSYLAAYFGMAIASHSMVLFVVALFMFAIYFAAARFEEKKFALSVLAGEYALYRRRTGMFLPRFALLLGALQK
jgi:protein-S-isoprenylcysteine O-methyltransferase Ste14